MRKRNPENKGLPARWRLAHGAYYYQVPPGLESQWDGKKLFRLGKTTPEAYRVWADRVAAPERITTVDALLDRYALEVIPEKEPKTRSSNQNSMQFLRPVFGSMALADIKPVHVYRYADLRSQKTRGEDGRVRGGKTAAHRDIEVLSHAFTKAVQWGLIDRHPFLDQVRLEGTKPRTRYVEDWEIVECLRIEARRKKGSVLAIQGYIRLKLLTGLRQADLLRLRLDQMQEDGIHVMPSKTEGSTGKSMIFEWSDELRKAVAMCKSARPRLSTMLFCTRDGKPYVDEDDETDSWKSMWSRFMARVLAETDVKERFTEHDLRAKVGSDAESLARAQQLLGHADAATTKRVYRRKAERIKPAA